jgi:hypothetical protein
MEFGADGGILAREGAVFWQSVRVEASAMIFPMISLESAGGLGRNRTGIDGFAVRYIATLPPGRPQEWRLLYPRRPTWVKQWLLSRLGDGAKPRQGVL